MILYLVDPFRSPRPEKHVNRNKDKKKEKRLRGGGLHKTAFEQNHRERVSVSPFESLVFGEDQALSGQRHVHPQTVDGAVGFPVHEHLRGVVKSFRVKDGHVVLFFCLGVCVGAVLDVGSSSARVLPKTFDVRTQQFLSFVVVLDDVAHFVECAIGALVG